MLLGRTLPDFYISDRNFYTACLLDGLSGILHQRKEQHLHLCRIGCYGHYVIRPIRLYFYVRRNAMPDQRKRVGDKIAQRCTFGLIFTPARVGQELVCQSNHTLGGVQHRLYILAYGLLLGADHSQKIDISKNTRQCVIKFVGDAACQVGDGFHFLGLSEAGFQPLAFTDIHNTGARQLAVAGRETGQPQFGQDFFAVGVDKSPFTDDSISSDSFPMKFRFPISG